MNLKSKKIWKELKHHMPFTALATLIAILIFIFTNKVFGYNFGSEFFHGAHYVHVLASAMATSAVFYKHKKNYPQALLIGITGAILIGSLSDVIFPFLGGEFLHFSVNFHLPLLKTPITLISFAFLGAIIGIFAKHTEESHFAHVLMSVLASMFYLALFATSSYILGIDFIIMFIIVFISVIIPCCISDIVYPLLFIRKKASKY